MSLLQSVFILNKHKYILLHCKVETSEVAMVTDYRGNCWTLLLLEKYVMHWMLCSLMSLLLWREFGRGQHRYTLLWRGIIVYADAGQPS